LILVNGHLSLVTRGPIVHLRADDKGLSMRYSWLDLGLFLLALVLLIPLVMRLVESVFDALGNGN
jgi:hypothetical protein